MKHNGYILYVYLDPYSCSLCVGCWLCRSEFSVDV